jgi:hypothetical protein
MTKAQSAHDVRAFIKKRFPGIQFKVRLSRNPFGGDDKYAVKVIVPPGYLSFIPEAPSYQQSSQHPTPSGQR